MNYKSYLALIEECKNYESADSIRLEYGFPPDCEFTSDGLIKAFDIIFSVSKSDISKLVEISGGNLSALCRKYNIPLRTVQNWVMGVRNAPEYVIQFLGFALISECEKEMN